MIGTSLGPWLIDSELGSGGMGAVYLATKGDERVAVKVVHPHLLDTPGFFKRFLREAEIGRTVTHPNVVRTLDCDALGGHHYLVMEYVEGQTLRELLDEIRLVPEELCLHIGLEVAKGMSAIHEAGVIHRDLKPENVLITGDHVVKVMDLGVARLTDEAIRLSQTGAFVGSIMYAAPEQFEACDDLDGRSDLHALGLVLYELATGVNPYFGNDVTQVIAKVLTEEPRRLGEAQPQCSAFFEEMVHTLLKKKREERFSSASELCSVLQDGEESEWWQERARTIRAVTRRPLRRVRIPRETAVYGRSSELKKLQSLYERARDGEGQVVLIEGEAGIGKSRLVDELVGRLHSAGEDLNFLFGSYPPGGAATASGAFSTAYREQIGLDGAAEYLRQTPMLAPAFEALLTGDATPMGSERLTREAVQTCFVAVTRGLAAEHPTIVLIDDLHFSPKEGRALFTALAMAVPGHRVLLIGTHRPGVSQDWVAGLTRLEQVTHLAVDRLGPKDLVRLLEDCLHSEHLAIELAGQIGLKSDGNPFFVFEIIRGLREEQRLTRREDGSWRTTGQIREIQIPSSVRDLISARVAELEESERELLEVAACCGFEFDPSLIARAVGAPLLPTLKQFARIEHTHQLVHSAGRRYRFDHHQVQEALYDQLFDQLREQYHAALGDALETHEDRFRRNPSEKSGAESLELCEHFFKGRLPDRALEYLDDALRHLEDGYLHDAVVELADRALAESGLVEGASRRELLLLKARSLDRVGTRREEQRAAIDEAVAIAEKAGDAGALAEALKRLGSLLQIQSKREEARTVFERALELARSAGDRRVEASAARSLGHLFRTGGRMEKARPLYERGMEIALELGDRREEAFAAGNLGLVMNHLGRYDDAIEYFNRDLTILRELADPRSEAKALGNMGNSLSNLGRIDEALECQERCLELSRETGDRQAEAIALFSLGGLIHGLGRLDEAREMYERCRDLAREIGFRLALAVVPGNLSLICRSLGRLEDCLAECKEHLEKCGEVDDLKGKSIASMNMGALFGILGDAHRAAEMCRQSIRVCRELGNKRIESYSLFVMAENLELTGDLEGAEAHYRQCLALRREIDYRAGLSPVLTGLGRLELREGRSSDAEAHLIEAYAVAKEMDSPEGRVLSKCLLALLPDGDRNSAESEWNEHSSRLGYLPLMEARFLMWRLSGQADHLEEARRLLAGLVENAPGEYRERMIPNVPLHLEIAAAHELLR